MKTLCALLLVGMASGASATSDSQYTLYGIGNLSCGEWVEHRRNGDNSMGWWTAGFVSGVGHEGKRLKATDMAAIEVWLDNHCQKNPLHTFNEGVKALVDTLTIK